MPYMIGQRVITLSLYGHGEIIGTIKEIDRDTTSRSPITSCRIRLDKPDEEARWGEIWRPISEVRAIPVIVQ